MNITPNFAPLNLNYFLCVRSYMQLLFCCIQLSLVQQIMGKYK